MKTKLLAVTILLAGCVPPRPSPPGQYDSKTLPPPNESRNTNTLGRDASDCERKAALSTAGNKAEAFNNCMKARRAPN
jgi:hypothetical protein